MSVYPNTQEVEARRLEAQGSPWPCSKLEASLAYMSIRAPNLCLCLYLYLYLYLYTYKYVYILYICSYKNREQRGKTGKRRKQQRVFITDQVLV